MPAGDFLYNQCPRSIERQYFYTLVSLLELKKNVDEAYPRLLDIGTFNLRIVNIEAVLKYMFDIIDAEFITGSTAAKSIHLLKLTMLCRYMAIYNEKGMPRMPNKTFPNYAKSISTIAKAGWLQLMAELTL